ncbi:hypothetical protein L2E82_18536 [Cichorium intybus]|uniref:Uncharacterized protein n=1 Tax=Cichorium intybus TaxID=13427 RepID=A0ACB9FA04_CICIN|nr:hypothetical protein L2E82_18536 [Cichorium intybus]
MRSRSIRASSMTNWMTVVVVGLGLLERTTAEESRTFYSGEVEVEERSRVQKRGASIAPSWRSGHNGSGRKGSNLKVPSSDKVMGYGEFGEELRRKIGADTGG